MPQNFFNAAYADALVYSPEGEPLKTTRLNAIDLVRTAGYMWNQGGPAKAPEIVTAPVDEPPTPVEEPVAAPEPAPVDEEPKVDHVGAPLAEVALAVAGADDVEKYLEGFTDDALRTMAEERYGQKVHHKTSRENIIAKIVGWEAEKLAAETD